MLKFQNIGTLSLACSDSLMALYLLLGFNNEFTNTVCWLASAIVVLSLTMGSHSIFLITLEKLLFVLQPHLHLLRQKRFVSLLLASWFLNICLSLSLSYIKDIDNFVCFGFDISNSGMVHKIFSFIMFGFNVMLIIMHIVMSVYALFTYFESKNNLKIVVMGKRKMVLQNIFISCTSLFSWIVVCCLLMFYNKTTLSPYSATYMYILQTGLPINSLINPILKTFTTEQVFAKYFKGGGWRT